MSDDDALVVIASCLRPEQAGMLRGRHPFRRG
jgi:hypothetical protein